MKQVQTDIDRLLSVLGTPKTVPVISNELSMEESHVRDWLDILSAAGVVRIDYPVNPMHQPTVFREDVKSTARGFVLESIKGEVDDSYSYKANGINVKVEIIEDRYVINYPRISTETHIVLEHLGAQSEIDVELDKNLCGMLEHMKAGLGELEMLLSDANLEEVVINTSKYPISVYHKHYGWLKSNIIVSDEEAIYNLAAHIGRMCGKEINNSSPLMDAHLPNGDRVNATLSPVSEAGNTISIRKFRSNPWTIVDFIDESLSAEMAALLWMAVQYELNVMVAGGTASGKTSMLNALLAFVPYDQHVISIEDTREIQLPSYQNWNYVPLVSRERNEISMLTLMQNALRMRPDRMIVGEIRRSKEAQVLFESMHTGHSAISTMHANTAEGALRRLTEQPIGIAPSVIDSLHLIVVQYRNRRTGERRVYEICEVQDGKAIPIYVWDPKTDKFKKKSRAKRISKEISRFTGMTPAKFNAELKKKVRFLKNLKKKKIQSMENVGEALNEYYYS